MVDSVVGPEAFWRHRRARYLWWSLLGSLAATSLYAWHDPVGGRSGRTVVGYALGGGAAALMLWLAWFGVRKRSYYASGAPLRGWLSAHVYFGLALPFLVLLHCAFRLGWNVHTFAFVLLLLVAISGIAGVVAYGILPDRITHNRGGRRFESLFEEVASLDQEVGAVASQLPDRFSRAAARAIEETRIGGSAWRQLRGRDPHCATARALQEVLAAEKAANPVEPERSRVVQLIELLARKDALLDVVARDVRQRALLELWLWFHVPLSVAALVAVAVHVFVVFYYW